MVSVAEQEPGHQATGPSTFNYLRQTIDPYGMFLNLYVMLSRNYLPETSRNRNDAV